MHFKIKIISTISQLKITKAIKPLVLAIAFLSTITLAWCQPKDENDCKICAKEGHIHEKPYNNSFKKELYFTISIAFILCNCSFNLSNII